MNIALWIIQILLAVLYGMAGVMKTFQTEKAKQQFSWAKERSDGFVRFVGISELLGAIGLILPMITGILPWLTPLAALGLSIIQLLAIFTVHVPRKEYNILPVNLVLLALSLLVIIGQRTLFS